MIGLDVVDVKRFEETLRRSAGLQERLFTDAERAYCDAKGDPIRHLAGTLAAKEAVIKAVRLGNLVAWARRIEITRRPDGVPQATVAGRADLSMSISISHDGGWAAATALVHRARNTNLQSWLT